MAQAHADAIATLQLSLQRLSAELAHELALAAGLGKGKAPRHARLCGALAVQA